MSITPLGMDRKEYIEELKPLLPKYWKLMIARSNTTWDKLKLTGILPDYVFNKHLIESIEEQRNDWKLSGKEYLEAIKEQISLTYQKKPPLKNSSSDNNSKEKPLPLPAKLDIYYSSDDEPELRNSSVDMNNDENESPNKNLENASSLPTIPPIEAPPTNLSLANVYSSSNKKLALQNRNSSVKSNMSNMSAFEGLPPTAAREEEAIVFLPEYQIAQEAEVNNSNVAQMSPGLVAKHMRRNSKKY